MAVTREEILEALKEMSLLEASELVKDIEETFGVSAAAPVAVFATSLIVEAWGAGAAALALAVCWGAATIWALTTHTLRDLAEEDGSAAAPSDVRTADRNAGPAAVGAEHPAALAE